MFSAESYGTYGVEDIYVSLNEGGKWTEPRNLGTLINTQFQELSPSLDADKKTLYFSSNGRKGSGSFDIYSATRLDDTWTNWSAPENLGPEINSEGRELFYRAYPALGFALYTTTKSSDGYGDLRVYTPRQPLPGHDTVIYASLENQPVDKETKAPRTEEIMAVANADKAAVDVPDADAVRKVHVHGRITNARTGESIPARISFEGPGLPPRTIASGQEGYSLDVKPREIYPSESKPMAISARWSSLPSMLSRCATGDELQASASGSGHHR